MKTSTQDKVEGHTKNLVGKAKAGIGEAANDPKLRDEGRADQLEGKVQKKTGDVKKVFGK